MYRHGIADAVLVQIRGDIRIVHTGYSRRDNVRGIEVGQMDWGYGVTWIRIQVRARTVRHIEVREDFRVNTVNWWSIGVTAWIRLVQPVQGVRVIVGVADPVEVLLVIVHVGRQVVSQRGRR